jgi:TPP-dependent trihydroxycyclohexane-1,2-dione (THcHDO) dehydratase
MGYALPAALAAKLAHPERVVVAATGDGDFLMTGQELATAVRERLGVLVLLADNGVYGTIRMHQELAYPGRVMATGLTNPDFAAYARAFGAHGEAVARTEQAFGLPLPIVSATAETLVERLRPLVESAEDRRRIGEASRAYVERVHDAEKLADRLIEIYERL